MNEPNPRTWSAKTMQTINELTPGITGRAFDPDWFLLRQRLEQFDDLRADYIELFGLLKSATAWIRRAGGDCINLDLAIQKFSERTYE